MISWFMENITVFSQRERGEPLAFALFSGWKTKTQANFRAKGFQLHDNGELTYGHFFTEGHGECELSSPVPS